MTVWATLGGKRLAALRTMYGLSQYKVGEEAEIGGSNLGRYETGERDNIRRDGVERILDAIDRLSGYKVRFSQRKEVMEGFGYIMDNPLPGDRDVAWASEIFHNTLDDDHFPYPAYLLDCAGRIWGSNRFVQRLFRNVGVDQRSIGALRNGNSLLQALFDTSSGLRALFAPEYRAEFLRGTLETFKREYGAIYGEEVWFKELIEELRTDYAEFRQYWDETQNPNIQEFAGRPFSQLPVHPPGKEFMLFFVTTELYIRDQRFRNMYLLPANEAAITLCNELHEPLPLGESPPR